MNNEQKCTLGQLSLSPLSHYQKKIAAHDTRGESVTIPEKQQPSCELSFNLCEAGEETKSSASRLFSEMRCKYTTFKC